MLYLFFFFSVYDSRNIVNLILRLTILDFVKDFLIIFCSSEPKFILKPANTRINFNMKTPVPSYNKENIIRRTPLTATAVKLKTPG